MGVSIQLESVRSAAAAEVEVEEANGKGKGELMEMTIRCRRLKEERCEQSMRRRKRM